MRLGYKRFAKFHDVDWETAQTTFPKPIQTSAYKLDHTNRGRPQWCCREQETLSPPDMMTKRQRVQSSRNLNLWEPAYRAIWREHFFDKLWGRCVRQPAHIHLPHTSLGIVRTGPKLQLRRGVRYSPASELRNRQNKREIQMHTFIQTNMYIFVHKSIYTYTNVCTHADDKVGTVPVCYETWLQVRSAVV